MKIEYKWLEYDYLLNYSMIDFITNLKDGFKIEIENRRVFIEVVEVDDEFFLNEIKSIFKANLENLTTLKSYEYLIKDSKYKDEIEEKILQIYNSARSDENKKVDEYDKKIKALLKENNISVKSDSKIVANSQNSFDWKTNVIKNYKSFNFRELISKRDKNGCSYCGSNYKMKIAKLQSFHPFITEGNEHNYINDYSKEIKVGLGLIARGKPKSCILCDFLALWSNTILFPYISVKSGTFIFIPVFNSFTDIKKFITKNKNPISSDARLLNKKGVEYFRNFNLINQTKKKVNAVEFYFEILLFLKYASLKDDSKKIKVNRVLIFDKNSEVINREVDLNYLHKTFDTKEKIKILENFINSFELSEYFKFNTSLNQFLHKRDLNSLFHFIFEIYKAIQKSDAKVNRLYSNEFYEENENVLKQESFLDSLINILKIIKGADVEFEELAINIGRAISMQESLVYKFARIKTKSQLIKVLDDIYLRSYTNKKREDSTSYIYDESLKETKEFINYLLNKSDNSLDDELMSFKVLVLASVNNSTR